MKVVVVFFLLSIQNSIQSGHLLRRNNVEDVDIPDFIGSIDDNTIKFTIDEESNNSLMPTTENELINDETTENPATTADCTEGR